MIAQTLCKEGFSSLLIKQHMEPLNNGSHWRSDLAQIYFIIYVANLGRWLSISLQKCVNLHPSPFMYPFMLDPSVSRLQLERENPSYLN